MLEMVPATAALEIVRPPSLTIGDTEMAEKNPQGYDPNVARLTAGGPSSGRTNAIVCDSADMWRWVVTGGGRIPPGMSIAGRVWRISRIATRAERLNQAIRGGVLASTPTSDQDPE